MNSCLKVCAVILGLLAYAPPATSQHIQALQNQDGRMEIFVNDLYHIYQQDHGNPWSDWRRFDTRSILFGSLAGRKKDGSLFLIKLNLESIITCFQVIPNGGWDYILTSLISGLLDSEHARSHDKYTYAANHDGTISFFIIGRDRSCWWIDKMHTSGSLPYKNFGGTQLRMITAATNQDGRNELFAIGGDKSIYHRWQTSVGGDWGGWQSLGGRDIRSITTALNADGRLEVFAIGGNNVIYYISQVTANGSFGNWQTLGGQDIRQIAVIPNADGRLELFALGGDEVVYHTWQLVPNGSFGNWARLGGSKIKAISPVKDRQGRLNMFVIGGNGSVYYKSQVSAGGSWPEEWNNLGIPPQDAVSSILFRPDPPPQPRIGINFKAEPNNGYINIGATATLIWDVQQCGTNCTVNLKGWNGLGFSQQILNKNVTASGQLVVQPTETNTKYTLTASGSNGSANKTVTIDWAPNSGTPPSCTYFYFKMTGSSTVTPCFMIAVCAADLEKAKAKAENENGGYTAAQVTQQEFLNGCN